MAPMNFTYFLPIFMHMLKMLIKKFSKSFNDIYNFFMFMAVLKDPVNFDLLLEDINSMSESDKDFYLSYYLLCTEDIKPTEY